MSKDARAIVETVECRNKGTCRRKCPTTPCNRIASSAAAFLQSLRVARWE